MAANSLISLYGSTYGSLYLAAVMSTAFYGVTCVQTLFYYIHYQNDPLRIKNFVGAIWVFDTIHEALSVSGAYKFIIAGLENPSSIADGVPELILQILLTGIVAIITQGFFIHRIYIFSGKSIVVPLIWVPLAIFQLVASIMYVARALYSAHGIHVAKLRDGFFVDVVVSSLSVAAVVDVLTAIFMTFLLVRKRSATGYSSVAHILQRLIVFTINTGIWTASFAILSVILLLIYPGNLRYAMFGIPLCSVYCNTLLANLNVRVYCRDKMMEHTVDLQASGDCKTDEQSGETVTELVQTEHHRGATFLVTNAPKQSDPENVYEGGECGCCTRPSP